MNRRVFWTFACMWMCLLLAVGCASVAVRKATDDSVKGFRYYLPRPYISVKKPFPVAGGDLYVSGLLEADGAVNLEGAEESLPPALLQQLPSLKLAPELVFKSPSHSALEELKPTNLKEDEIQNAQGLASDETKVLPTADKWLKGSKVDPAILDAGKIGFDVTIVLSHKAGFTSIKDPVVGLVPVVDGKPQKDLFVKLSEQKTEEFTEYKPPDSEGKNGSDGKYVAHGQRDELKHGPYYACALRFKGEGSAAEGTYIGYLSSPGLHIVGAKPAIVKPSTSTTKKKGTQVGASSANVTISGDPRTDPLKKVNDYFDVLLLPDFEEQYAVQINGGLGKGKGALGLENGWMVEHASVDVDNSGIGEFVFSQIDGLIDLATAMDGFTEQAAESAASDLKDAAKGILPPGSPGFEASEIPTVTLRVRYIREALPGLYPLLKPGELPNPDYPAIEGANPPDYLLVPFRPYTAIAYNTRYTIRVELLGTSP